MKPFFLILLTCFLGALIFIGIQLKKSNENETSNIPTLNLNPISENELETTQPAIEPERTAEDETLEKLIEAADYKNTETRKFALEIANKFAGEKNIKQVCAIYRELYTKWKYVSDPSGEEYFAKASESINNNLTGDCDDFAILMCSTLRTIGFKTRITAAYNDEGGHAFCEVYLNEEPSELRRQINYQYSSGLQDLFGESEVKEINFKRSSEDDEGIWLNVDWTSRYPGGKYYDYKTYTIYDLQGNSYIKGENKIQN